jgi:leader peptidase (prepilin peptidase)/N-methyltransferase
MGGGDIKLTASAGFVLGFPLGMSGLIFGLSAVLLYHLIILSIQKLKHINAPTAGETLLPLAPFLSAGFLASYLLKFGGLTL